MGKKIQQVGLRLADEELARLDQVVAQVRKRNPHMDRSKVLREIIGFDATSFVTENDRLFLRAAFIDESEDADSEQASRAPS